MNENLQTILSINQQIDAAKLQKSLALAAQLRRQGLEPIGYRLATPGGSRRVRPTTPARPRSSS